VLVVDVFMGSLVGMLLEAGAAEVWVCQGPKVARIVGEGDAVLLGEQEGLPLEGFHYRASLQGLPSTLNNRRCMLVAPQLNEALTGCGSVLLGHFRNAKAAIAAAQAHEVGAIVPVTGHPPVFSLGNTLAAAFLFRRLQQLGHSAHRDTELMVSALLKSFPDPQEAVFQSELGQRYYHLGRTEDIALASLISVDSVVAHLHHTRLLKASEHHLSQDRYAYCFKATP
jgi:2-phosphosulfolactate phosphatase